MAAYEFLHPVILRVGHVQVAARVEREAPRVVEFSRRTARPTDQFQHLPLRIQHRQAAVPELTNVLPPLLVHAHIVWVTELSPLTSRPAEFTNERAVRPEHLHTVVARVGDEQFAGGGKRQSLGAIELPRRMPRAAHLEQHRLPVGSKPLHALHDLEFTHVGRTVRADRHRARKGQLPAFAPVHAPLRNQPSLRREMVDPRIVRLHHHDVSLVIARHALGTAARDLRHLPLQQVVAVGIKFLDAPGHVADIHIVVPIDRDRPRLDELPRCIPAASQHVHLGENLALERPIAWPRPTPGRQPKHGAHRHLAKRLA